MGTVWGLLLGLLAGIQPVAAEELPSGEAVVDPVLYTGRRVLSRSLVAPLGGLPDEDLEPLLRVQQDSLYSPKEVRQDIATLARVGDFAQVEVLVEPWVQPGPDGEPVEGVYVTYQVYPPPRLERVWVDGNRVIGKSALQRLAGLESGQIFFPEQAAVVQQRIQDAYVEKGWVNAVVQVSSSQSSDRRVQVKVKVEEGEPQRLSHIEVRRRDALSRLRVRTLLWKNGIFVGRPYKDSSLRALEEDLKDVLLKKGYYASRARVTPVQDQGGTELVVVLNPQRRYYISRDGHGLPPKAEIVSSLRLKEGALLSRSFAADASERLETKLRDRGYAEASVTVRLKEGEGRVDVEVQGSRGPAHRIGRSTWSGNPQRSPSFLRGALREASPKLLQLGQVTRPGVESALLVLREYYRSQGFLSARLQLDEYEPGPARWVPLRGQVRRVALQVAVEPGPQAQLVDAQTEGGDLDMSALLNPLVGQPLNPSALDERCRLIAQRYQEAGYLEADARAQTTVSADGTQAVVVVKVVPGPQVYLRSVLISGYQRTRRLVVEREITIGPGDILSPSTVSEIRRRLYQLDVFSRVDVEVVGDEDRIKDMVVRLEERPNLYAEAGGSAATDQGVQFFGRAGHRNLFGLGHRLTFLGQVGLGWRGDGWTLDNTAVEWRAAARYEAPDVPTRGEQLAGDLLFNAQDQERWFRIGRSGLAVSLRLSLGGRSTAELAYRLQVRRLLDADPALLIQGDPWRAVMGLDSGAPVAFPSGQRAQSGLALSLLLDFRDDAFNPRKGVAASAEVVVSDGLGNMLMVDAPDAPAWLRAEATLSGYVPLGKLGLLLRLRGGTSFVGGEGTLPVEERFRLGGGSNLRGFDLDGVGPANLSVPGDIPYPPALEPLIAWASRDEQRWVPSGGDSLGLASIELKVPLDALGMRSLSSWQVALFSDVGNVWFLKKQIVADSARAGLEPLLRYSVGIGVRRATVVGPIQLDLGINPSPVEAFGESGLLPFLPPMRLHLSLGAL